MTRSYSTQKLELFFLLIMWALFYSSGKTIFSDLIIACPVQIEYKWTQEELLNRSSVKARSKLAKTGAY